MALPLALSLAAGAHAANLRTEVVTSGLQNPWGLAFIDGGRMLVTERPGRMRVVAPDGTLLGRIKVPEVVANLCFGGAKYNVLYICGTTSLYSIWLMINGAKVV